MGLLHPLNEVFFIFFDDVKDGKKGSPVSLAHFGVLTFFRTDFEAGFCSERCGKDAEIVEGVIFRGDPEDHFLWGR